MSAFLTKSMARNIFYGGTLFSVLLFLALTLHTCLLYTSRCV